MELDLQSLFELLCTAVQLYSLDEAPTLPSRICAHIRGRFWSANTDDLWEQQTKNRVYRATVDFCGCTWCVRSADVSAVIVPKVQLEL